jgi:hypothetical protein
MYKSEFNFSYDDMETRWRLMHNGVEIDLYESASLLNAKLIRIAELEARLKVDALYPNCREYLSQQTCRINACIKHIEERYDSQEPWTTPEEVKAILRGGSE